MVIVINLKECRAAKMAPVTDEGVGNEGFYFLDDEAFGYDENDYYYDDDDPGMGP